MKCWLRILVGLGLVWLATLRGAAAMVESSVAALRWDALEKSYSASPGEAEVEFSFEVTNTSESPIEILNLSTSCSCTAAIMGEKPWILEPGESDQVRVKVDVRSRRGGLTKTVYVSTSAGEQLLLVHVQVPPPPAVQREMNMMAAQADRQSILRGDCARCHVAPGAGKHGRELFEAACQICHGAEHRASFVPDLTKPTVARDATYWEKWIRHGGAEGTLMPAFAREHGGSLDDDQIASLVKYLTKHMSSEPPAK
jgi:mono/diheme cytochrome c family protein